MTLKITLASNEVEDFVIEMLIDADATFLDLHNLILEGCGYVQGDNHRFYVCDENWRPESRILLADDGSVGSDEDLNLMCECHLGDYLEDEGQRMAYSFDPESPRKFLLEVSELIFGNPQKEPAISRMMGMPPMQSLAEDEIEDLPVPQNPEEEMDEAFLDDEGFDSSEIDIDGFDILG